jgi:Family of unknown function (DUF6448)
MTTHQILVRMSALLSMLILTVLLSSPAMAHCDSMDGPVVKDAQRALADRNVGRVLKWVRKEDEEPIRKAFEMTLAVRGESDAAKSVADQYFFEMLVRIHRASEGEGFTGIKPSGSVDPAIAAADHALADGNIDPLADKIAASIRNAIKERFAEAYQRRQAAEKSADQGREYVEAYVQLTHFVESADHLASHGASPKHREN